MSNFKILIDTIIKEAIEEKIILEYVNRDCIKFKRKNKILYIQKYKNMFKFNIYCLEQKTNDLFNSTSLGKSKKLKIFFKIIKEQKQKEIEKLILHQLLSRKDDNNE